MSLSIVADESVDFRIVTALRAEGFEVYAVVHECPGVPDQQVFANAVQRSAVLLTEDSDFGEWIFAHGLRGVPGVVYLRYGPQELTGIIHAVQMVLRNHNQVMDNRFVTITPKKIRARTLT